MYSTLELILSSGEFLAGNRLTIADISALSTMVVADLFLPVNNRFPKLKGWLGILRSQEWFEVAERGLLAVQHGLQAKLGPKIVQEI